MSTHGKVLVAMSGGVDSSVTAMLLHEQGYEVVGITMKTWSHNSSAKPTRKIVGCCTLDDINDARSIAVKVGFHHSVIDIQQEFGDWVVQHFVNEYMAGRTPNPCILCNTHIKWDALLKRAALLGCDYIATGHYASVRYDNPRYVISQGKDSTKDQSYALWGVSQNHLSKTILPLGKFYKTEIRDMAKRYGLTQVWNKPDSYEICFIPDNDYRGFLKKKAIERAEKIPEGFFVDKQGNKLGKHKGVPYYTIGQRKGIGIAFGEPRYVTNINPVTNEIVLGVKEDLLGHICYAESLNFVKCDKLSEEPISVKAKIRYNDKGSYAMAWQKENILHVQFPKGKDAVTPGQAVVCYDDDDVMVGGWITKAE